MQPTWQSKDGAIVLYHADCLDVLPTLESGSVDAVVTDPPYEGMKGGTVINHRGVTAVRQPTKTIGNELGSPEGLVQVRRIAKFGAISFCSYHWIESCAELLGGQKRCLISWFKRNSPYSVNNAPWFMTEYAWAVQYTPGIDWRELRTHIDEPSLPAGCMADERIVDGGRAVHPTQKPIAVMRAVFCSGMGSVLDPYMGLATTGIACIRTGRRFIGIEKDERYFEIARKRIEAELASTPLFDRIEETQGDLWEAAS